MDTEGFWNELVDLFEQGDLPAIFHFAGHGKEDGSALIFKGEKGEPREIQAQQLASLLAKADRRNQRVRFVFLNACHSANNGKKQLQPFGGIGRQLTASGIPMVAALLAPVEDGEARELAEAFYQRVGEGQPLDVALQATRRNAFLREWQGIAWAFLTFTAAGSPTPVWIAAQGSGKREPSAPFLRFGFREQWERLERFLYRLSPMVVVVNGERHAGHRHVLERFQFELEHYPGKTRFLHVRTLGLSAKIGEPTLARAHLIGAIARAFDLTDSGSETQIIHTIAKAMEKECVKNTVLVVDLVEVLELVNPAWSDALLLLIEKVWVEVVGQAARSGADLPVYLLISVAWPPKPNTDNPKAKAIQNARVIGKKAIATLSSFRGFGHGIKLEVLPELKSIETEYVATFLEDALDMTQDEAEQQASSIVHVNDNESILRKIKTLLYERLSP
ncbi:MAG: CHAT domain-containing protein [Magnetococcales bacterium]|nr:CHAT domain-containing protein [Magnetococcales bacterium]